MNHASDQSLAGIESPTPVPHLSSIRRAAGVVSFAGKSHQEAMTGQEARSSSKMRTSIAFATCVVQDAQACRMQPLRDSNLDKNS
jgi:hypothetical protein